jgi:hypothetical protein
MLTTEVKMSEHPNNIMLICQAVDDGFYPLGNVCSLDISPTILVHGFKNSIKAEALDDLGHVTANELKLWKLSRSWPIDGDNESISAIQNLLDVFQNNLKSVAQKLNPSFCVSWYFKESLPDRHLHLIVQAPVPGVGGTNPFHLSCGQLPTKPTTPSLLSRTMCSQ